MSKTSKRLHVSKNPQRARYKLGLYKMSKRQTACCAAFKLATYPENGLYKV